MHFLVNSFLMLPPQMPLCSLYTFHHKNLLLDMHDIQCGVIARPKFHQHYFSRPLQTQKQDQYLHRLIFLDESRSEERRVGKECRLQWWGEQDEKEDNVLLII